MEAVDSVVDHYGVLEVLIVIFIYFIKRTQRKMSAVKHRFCSPREKKLHRVI